jgi:hypothetical protein
VDYDGADVLGQILYCQSDLRLESDVRHAQCTNHPTMHYTRLSFPTPDSVDIFALAAGDDFGKAFLPLQIQ